MDLSFPESDLVDSRCHRTLPDEGDTTPLERCKDEAVTWFADERGSRIYVCEDHAREVLRFGEADEDVLDMDYQDLRAYASTQGINLQHPSLKDLQRTLLVAPDAAELADHPRVSPCRGCAKLTLLDDLDPVAKRCKACREGYPEIDTSNAALSSEV